MKYPHGNNKTIYLDIQPVLSYFDVVYTETLVYTFKNIITCFTCLCTVYCTLPKIKNDMWKEETPK